MKDEQAPPSWLRSNLGHGAPTFTMSAVFTMKSKEGRPTFDARTTMQVFFDRSGQARTGVMCVEEVMPLSVGNDTRVCTVSFPRIVCAPPPPPTPAVPVSTAGASLFFPPSSPLAASPFSLPASVCGSSVRGELPRTNTDVRCQNDDAVVEANPCASSSFSASPNYFADASPTFSALLGSSPSSPLFGSSIDAFL